MGKPNPAITDSAVVDHTLANFRIGVRGELFNGKMQEARRDNGLTTKALASEVGVPVQVIEDIELMRLVPEEGLATLIAEAIGQPVGDLFPPGVELFQQTGRVELVATVTEWSEALRLGEPAQVASLSACCLLSSADPCEIAEQREERRGLNRRWSNLPLLQKAAVGLHFGLLGGVQHSFEQIARLLGCSETRAKVHVGTGLYNLNPLEVPDD